MATVSKTSSARKAERRVSLSDFVNNVASLTITTIEHRVRSEPKITVFGYFLHRIPADFGIGFRFEKFDDIRKEGEPNEYDVNIDPRGHHTCTCKGNTFHGHCKHVESLLALANSGRIQLTI